MIDTNWSFTSFGTPTKMPVSIVPGLITFTRMCRSFRSTVQVRAKRADGRLARVIDAEAREAFRAGDRAGHDDRAAVPYQRQCLLDREQRAPDVDVESVVEICLRDGTERNVEFAETGAGVQNVDMTLLRLDR